MVENPQGWGKAERIVCDALEQGLRARDEGLVGLSIPRQITDALRKAGLLKEESDGDT